MRAVRYHSHGLPDVLGVEQFPEPVPGSDRIGVRIATAGSS